MVTEFLYGARSREAARALLAQRHLEQQRSRPKVLQRGSTAPAASAGVNAHYGPNPCNPSTCDFWPHCAHRDGLYTTTTGKSTPLATSPVPPTTLRLSQSYPNTVNHKDRKGRREATRNGYQSTRSSPASLERMDISPTKHFPKRGNSLSVPATTPTEEWRTLGVGPHCRQHAHTLLPQPTRTSPAPTGLRVGLSDTSSSAGSSMDATHTTTTTIITPTSGISPDPTKVSPIEVNSVIVNNGDSSASSSSSDIWVTTSDRTVTKSPRNAKSSGASTPLDEGRASKSPIRTSDDDHSRPGSAPAYQDRTVVDTQQRSLSLPKSFQSVRDIRHRSDLMFILYTLFICMSCLISDATVNHLECPILTWSNHTW